MRSTNLTASMLVLHALTASRALAVPTANLSVHLDADSSVTTSGSAVTGWTELQNSITFTPQAHGSDDGRPTLVSSGAGQINGNNVVRFDTITGNFGDGDRMVSTGNSLLNFANQATFFAVGRFGGKVFNTILNKDGANDRMIWDVNAFIAANGAQSIYDGTTWHSSNTATVPLDQPVLLEVHWDATAASGNLDFYVGGVLTGSVNTTTNWIATPGGLSEIFLGVQGTSNFGDFDLAELLMYRSTLSAADVTAIRTELGAEYVVAVPEPSLGAGVVLVGLLLAPRRRRRNRLA
jgi:hypothetical protein